MKKVATMQDISCVGKCSLTAALPVLSAMGIETAVLPTAVLSTHTMFHGFTFHDLTNEIPPIMDHWQKEHFHFDAVYTGYLGSIAQLKDAAMLFSRFGTGIRMADPCMGDDGRLYTGFTEESAAKMADFCRLADIIVPNMTEASFLLKIPYRKEYDEAYIKDILRRLTSLGCRAAVLTGVSLQKDHIGAYAYDREKDHFTFYFDKKEPASFHGTGDLFAAALLGAIVNGRSFAQSLKIACCFVKRSIHLTLAEKDHDLYGVNFEQAIPYLIHLLKE